MSKPVIVSARRPATPAEAAQMAAAEQGVEVPDHVARAVADAVLAQYETVVNYRTQMMRHMWDTLEAREYALKDIRHKLIDEALSEGYVPAALPEETRRYYVEPWAGPDTEVPAEVAEADPDSWQSIVLTFTMPVRKVG